MATKNELVPGELEFNSVITDGCYALLYLLRYGGDNNRSKFYRKEIEAAAYRNTQCLHFRLILDCFRMLLQAKKGKPQEAVIQIHQMKQRMDSLSVCIGRKMDKFYHQALDLLQELIMLFQQYNYEPRAQA